MDSQYAQMRINRYPGLFSEAATYSGELLTVAGETWFHPNDGGPPVKITDSNRHDLRTRYPDHMKPRDTRD